MDFGEPPQREVPRIVLPRTRVNKGKERGHGCFALALVRYVYVALTRRRDDGGLVSTRHRAIIRVGRLKSR
jgi:hypothetical protein